MRLYVLCAIALGVCLVVSLVTADGGNDVEETNEWAVKLDKGVNPDTLAAELGMRNLGPIGSLAGMYRFELMTPDAKRSCEASLRSHEGILWSEQQVRRQRYTRDF